MIPDVDQADEYMITRLEKDLREAAKTMGPNQVRFLVDHYYGIQEYRKAAANQERALHESGEPIEILGWFSEQNRKLERYLKVTLDLFASNHPIGSWMMNIRGIGPVIASGLLAHIDIHKAPTVGHIWAFGGVVPGVVWERGQRRPWNNDLKTLFWKIGDSFVKFSGGEKPTPYGYRYRAWKNLYIARNERGDYADLAKETLATRNFSKDTVSRKAYESGKLPDGRIDLRARRKAVKLFLSHLHDFWYRYEFNAPPPAPYVLEHLGHTHYFPRPDQVDPNEWEKVYSRVPETVV